MSELAQHLRSPVTTNAPLSDLKNYAALLINKMARFHEQKTDTCLQWLHLVRKCIFLRTNVLLQTTHVLRTRSSRELGRRGFKKLQVIPWVSSGSWTCRSFFPNVCQGHNYAEEHPISGPGTGDREEEEGAGKLRGSSSSLLLAEAAANFLWLALTTCLKALQCRKEIFQEIKLLLFPVWLSSLVYEKKALRALEKRFVWIAGLLWFISPSSRDLANFLRKVVD